MIAIDDFVMLGKTVPEPTRTDGRIFVCSAGVSTQMRQLVRIYPLARHGAPARWTINRVELERNSKDSRHESWKLAGDRSPGAHDQINNTFTVTGEVAKTRRADLLKPFTIGSIKQANAARMSLAVLHPKDMRVSFDFNPDSPDSPQQALFDTADQPPSGAKRFPYIPRLHFHDEDGGHDLMIRDWGVYERMRKAGGFELWSDSRRREDITAALHLDESCSLLVGNFNQHRTSWLVISVLRGLRAPEALFDTAELGWDAAIPTASRASRRRVPHPAA